MKKQHGLTLIELMISLALGLIIIAATLTIYINTIRSSGDTLKAVRLNHDLEMALNLMVNDIRRAGYWRNATINPSTPASQNPFTADALTANPTTTARTNIQILTANTTTVADPGSCILYTYDADNDGVVDNNEHFGFRIVNNTLEMRLSGTSTVDCTTSGNGNSWQEFIDGNMLNITNLQFSFLPMGSLTATSRCWNLTTTVTADNNNTIDCAAITATPTPTTAKPHDLVVKRVVNISVSGQLDTDTDVTKTITGTVQIRNNRFFQKTS